MGLKVEIVLETNPYVTPANAPLIARVLHDGNPVAGLMLKVFHRPPGTTAAIQPTRLRTDDDGRVLIENLPRGEVLLSAAIFPPLAPIAAKGSQ